MMVSNHLILLLCVISLVDFKNSPVLVEAVGRAFPIASVNAAVDILRQTNPRLEWNLFLVNLAGRHARCKQVSRREFVDVKTRTPNNELIRGIVTSTAGEEADVGSVTVYIRNIFRDWQYDVDFKQQIKYATSFGCAVRPSCKGKAIVACLFSPGYAPSQSSRTDNGFNVIPPNVGLGGQVNTNTGASSQSSRKDNVFDGSSSNINTGRGDVNGGKTSTNGNYPFEDPYTPPKTSKTDNDFNVISPNVDTGRGDVNAGEDGADRYQPFEGRPASELKPWEVPPKRPNRHGSGSAALGRTEEEIIFGRSKTGPPFVRAFTKEQYLIAEKIFGMSWDRSHFLENLSGLETTCAMAMMNDWLFVTMENTAKNRNIQLHGLFGSAPNRGSTEGALIQILNEMEPVARNKLRAVDFGCSVLPDCKVEHQVNRMDVVAVCLFRM